MNHLTLWANTTMTSDHLLCDILHVIELLTLAINGEDTNQPQVFWPIKDTACHKSIV